MGERNFGDHLDQLSSCWLTWMTIITKTHKLPTITHRINMDSAIKTEHHQIWVNLPVQHVVGHFECHYQTQLK